MSLKVRELSPALQQMAKDQLFEDPKRVPEIIEQFREWIKKSAHLIARTDDQFLVNFLRGCKYSMEKAKQKLDMFYTLRHHSPEMLQSRDPKELKIHEILKIGGMLPLPLTETETSPRIILGRVGGYDADEYKPEDLMKIFILVGDLIREEDDQMIIAGQINVIDLKEATLAHFMMWTPALMKKMTMLMQEANPIRLKAIHYINTPPFFEKIFNFFKQFLNEKNKSRISLHGNDWSSLYKAIPQRLLPKEYGGEAGSIDEIAQYWEDKIMANREFLIEQVTKYGVDEKKRIGRPKNPESLFGLDGSFRQLEFD